MSFTAGLVVCLVLPHRHPRVRSKGCGPCRHQTDGDGIGIRLEESVPTDPVLRPGTVVKGWRDRCAAGLEPGQLIFEPGNALLCLVLVRLQSFAKSQNRVNGWLDRQAKHDASHQDEHDEARENNFQQTRHIGRVKAHWKVYEPPGPRLQALTRHGKRAMSTSRRRCAEAKGSSPVQ